MSTPNWKDSHPVRRDASTSYDGPRATYCCTTCGHEKAIPEEPHRDGPETVQTGCPECDMMRSFRWRSSVDHIARLAGEYSKTNDGRQS